MLADVTEKKRIENGEDGDEAVLGKRKGREVEEDAVVEIEEEKCRATRG